MLKLYLSQTNPVVGNLDFNKELIISELEKAEEAKCDLVIFSELNLVGYPPEDLLNKKYFIESVEEKISEICTATEASKTSLLIGAPIYENNKLYNAAILISEGKIIEKVYKKELPNYGVFDEKRYFSASDSLKTINFKNLKIAILICEDAWNIENANLVSKENPDLVVTLNASPFSKNKVDQRLKVAQNFVKKTKKPFIYVNQIGGVDHLIFDGNSFIIDENGDEFLNMKSFAKDSAKIELKKSDQKIYLSSERKIEQKGNTEDLIYNATILGLRDYVRKTGFKKVLLGMSGGIDSALVASIAVDALGPENVKLFALPSRYNSSESLTDAKTCSQNLDIKLEVIEIEKAFQALLETLSPQFEGYKEDLTEENMQSRIRGNILMALSNKFGHLLLSTGNKSEMAVGYATIYGDMCGAYNPIKDIYKTEVFNICKWRNKNIPRISIYEKKEVIPESIINKEPSAELRSGQKDSDSLPEYEMLDLILFKMIEEEKSIEEIITETKFDHNLIKKIAKLFYSSEYKRKQSVIGAKVSEMSFDKDRRYLISNNFWL